MADGPVTRVKSCKQCGNQYNWIYGQTGRLRGTCSKECWSAYDSDRQRKRREERGLVGISAGLHDAICSICNEAFQYKRARAGRKRAICFKPSCNTERARLAGMRSRRKAGAIPLAEAIARMKVVYSKPRPIVPCRHCGTEFEARMSKKGQRQIFCSLTCRHESKRKYQSVREQRAAHRRSLGQVTWAEQQAMWAKERERKEAEKLAFLSKCIKCGGDVEVERQRPNTKVGCTCRACADQAALESRRKSRRIRKGMDRARMRRARVEPVDPFKVFERDGWRCHLCGCKTPKEKRGTYHPKAPELDHIVPLSKGGEHSYRNTACACRACNAAKSDKILGQPSLLAA